MTLQQAPADPPPLEAAPPLKATTLPPKPKPTLGLTPEVPQNAGPVVDQATKS